MTKSLTPYRHQLYPATDGGFQLPRVSTHDRQTLPLQLKAMRQYVKQRKWKLMLQVEEVGSGSKQRPKREGLLKALRRREVVAIVVWKLDRRGRSLPDPIAPLAELRDLGIVVLLPTEALPLSSGSRSLW